MRGKYLSIIIDQNLQWKIHIENIVMRLRSSNLTSSYLLKLCMSIMHSASRSSYTI